MKKLILLLFIPLVFTCSSNNFLENNENIVFINDEQNVIYFKDSNNYLTHIDDYDSGCFYFFRTLDEGDIDLSCYNDGVFLTDEMICKIVANESSLLVEECLWCGENEKEKLIYKYSKVSDDILILEKNSGKVRHVSNDKLLDEPVLDLEVSNYGEQGLLGITSVFD